jgi:DNA-binding transcriptional LysR family regulator
MIERYQLRYFLAVVDAGTFSGAALQVSVSQPALSVGIAKLEAALGTVLFLRNSRRVQLTVQGSRFLSEAREIERGFNELEHHLAGSGQPRLLRLGVLSTIPVRLWRTVVEQSHSSDDGSILEVVEGTERDLLRRLERRRIDVALTVIRPGEERFSAEPLMEEGYAVALAPSHHLSREDTVFAEQLAEEPMIVRRHCEALPDISRHFTARGVRPRFSYRSTNDERTVEMVAAGLGVTLMPASYAPLGSPWPKLSEFELRRRVGILLADPDASQTHSGAMTALRRLAN